MGADLMHQFGCRISFPLAMSVYLSNKVQQLTNLIKLSFSFYLLYFVLPPFEDNGLLFWARDVLC